MTEQALRKRVGRIEKKLAAGQNVSAAQRAMVAAYRKRHRKYNTTGDAVAQAADTRDMDAEDERAIQEQLAAEGLDDSAAPTGQPDVASASVSSSTVGESTTDVVEDVASFSAETMDVPMSQAGVCPVATCKAPLADGQLRCGKCGTWARPDLCPKCRAPFNPGENFCRADGTPRPAVGAVVKAPGQAVAVETPVIRMWTEENTAWVMMAVDEGLRMGKMDPMSKSERKQLLDALIPVLNKRLPASGRFAEEIRLGVIVAGIFAPRVWIKYVIEPQRAAEERRKDELHAAKLAAIQTQKSDEKERTEEPVTVSVKAGA